MVKSNIGKLYIKKRTLPEWLTLYVFIFPFIISFLLDFLKLPDLFKYSVDVAWLVLVLILFFRRNLLLKRILIPFASFIGIFLLYTLIVYLFNFQSPFYFLWGFRNNFRVYAAFLAYATFFYEDDIENCFKFIDVLFWINIPVTFWQFFVLGLNQDYLGGIFGVDRGCNGYSIVFFSVVLSKSLLSYMNKNEKAVLCFLKCGVSLVLAAMSELKFFFVIFVFILVFSALLTRFSWQKFIVLLISFVLLYFAGSVLTSIFGDNERLTLERIFNLTTSSNYATTEDLGRFTAIPKISKSILTEFHSKLFGMGLGNCDTSAFAICNTPFYAEHSYLHYNWFSSAFLFLETGYIGLSINLLFIVACFVFALISLKKKRCNILHAQIAMIISILCIIITFYNASLRKEVAYIAYFALALPFVSYNNKVFDNS